MSRVRSKQDVGRINSIGHLWPKTIILFSFTRNLCPMSRSCALTCSIALQVYFICLWRGGAGAFMKTLVSLQYLRAIAALAVVLVHAVERREGQFELGHMGVDIFFVLSGFVMWLIAERAPRSPQKFVIDRIGRIAPTYWLATGFVLLLWVAGIRAGLDQVDLAHTIKSFLFVPSEYPGKEKIYPLVIPGWTLNYEMFFYAIFAVALFAKGKLRLAILTCAIVALVVAGQVFKPADPIGRTYTDPLMLEFLAGVWLGVLYTSRINIPVAVSLALLGAGTVLAVVFVGVAPDMHRVLKAGFPAIAIVAGVALYEREREVPPMPWLLLVGDASYAIYLWHFPTNPIWDHLSQAVGAPPWLAVTFMIAGGVSFGIAAHLLIEKPSQNWLKNHRRRAREVAMAHGQKAH